MNLDTNFVEVVFLAKLPALSASRFNVFICSDEPKFKDASGHERKMPVQTKTQVYCLRCPSKGHSGSSLGIDAFMVDKLPDGAIQLENSNFLLTFDVDTKLLSSIRHKKHPKSAGAKFDSSKDKYIEIEFGAYPTQQFRNGAYLFSTDSRRSDNVIVFNQR